MKKRFTSILKQRNPFESRSNSNGNEADLPQGDTPEANIARGLKLFCESGGPESTQGEEVLHLPVIVDAAESSPAAAAVAAQMLRKYLSMSNSSRPHTQYNAVMLMRILADNPGPTFTRNVDTKFVSTVKDVLRNCKDPSVQQILRETVMAMYRDKAYDTNLANLFAMWGKESGMQRPSSSTPPSNGAGGGPGLGTPYGAPAPGASGNSYRPDKPLPPPAELAARIEEAKTSAKLLQQFVLSTPQAELKSNDLVKEFAERCQSAQRSVQSYIGADNPAPDNETMQTLIETTEQLSLALSKHSRALLQARRAQPGATPSATPPPGSNGMSPPPSLPSQPGLGQNEQPNDFNASYAPAGQPPAQSAYSPPPFPPPSTVSRREVGGAPSAAALARHTYSPPPLPPPTQAIPPPPTSSSNPRSSVPAGFPPGQAGTHDDPFSDQHESAEDSAAPLPQSGLAHSGGMSRPGFNNVTSSYVRRQDSAEANFTMHGGVESTPVSPERKTHDRKASGPRDLEPVSPVFAGDEEYKRKR